MARAVADDLEKETPPEGGVGPTIRSSAGFTHMNIGLLAKKIKRNLSKVFG